MVGFVAAAATLMVNILLRLIGALPDSLDVGRLADWIVGPHGDPWLAFTFGAVLFVALGALAGGVYLAVVRRPSPLTGLAFAALIWLALNLILLPLNGSGFFGLDAGSPIAAGSLFLGVVFGALIGLLGERFHIVAGASGV